ncbi:MAG: TRAP transporter substrate-binding protein DctP [Gammaproteobacteria bacterium]
MTDCPDHFPASGSQRILGRVIGGFMLALLLALPVQAAERLRLATLAPADSPWGEVFNDWSETVVDRSRGDLSLEWSFGSRLDESALVARMRSGYLDGAFLSSVGLSQIRPELLVLRTPGLFDGWSRLDRVRDVMRADFESLLAAEGFVLIAWGDVGLIRLMSRGQAIRVPSDLSGAKVVSLKQDRLGPIRARALGYTPVEEAIPGVMSALRDGRVDVVTASALGARALGWHTELDHVTDLVMGVRSGAIVMRSDALGRLAPGLRELLETSGLRAGKSLSKRIRGDDRQAQFALRRRMTVVELSGPQRGAWYRAWKQMRGQLAGETFEAEFFKRVEGLAGVR